MIESGYDRVVRHLDGDPRNNDLDNLAIIRLCSACGSPDVREVERVAGIEGEAVHYTVLGCVDCGHVTEVEA